MNTNQINNRKAEFVLAMKENNRDLYRAIAPAEMMALLHNCNPVHYEEGIDVIIDNTDASEDMLMEYIDSNIKGCRYISSVVREEKCKGCFAWT